MKKGLYGRLAWMGIKKNRKLYLPYILTCIGTITMCYIISFLSTSDVFAAIPGGDTMQSFLSMGFGVMAVFSLIFLFYTYSFLIRRRKKEFGLYNILGLNKKNLALVLISETLMIALLTIAGGLFFGVLLSKLAELGMVKMLGGTASFSFIVGFDSLWRTAALFLGIYALIFLNALRQIHLSNPIQLLHSENIGEKPPKANWAVAVIGLLLLGGAYYLAVTIQDPITALTVFFFAVIMVIIATYMLFISGSVTLCRALQKNKKYYYKTNPFVSVSSLVFRMKRNGAGLASICILCTMVLVMVSSTVCLFVGAEDTLRNRYTRNINLDAAVSELELLDGPQTDAVKEAVSRIVSENGTNIDNELEYGTAGFAALMQGDELLCDPDIYNSVGSMADMRQVFIVSLQDYNNMMNSSEVLQPGQAILYATNGASYAYDSISIEGGEPIEISKQVESFADNTIDDTQMIPSLYLFVPDFEQVVTPLLDIMYDNTGIVSLHWYYGFDMPCDDDTQMAVQEQIDEYMDEVEATEEQFAHFHVLVEGVASERAGFYGMYGGLFFLGVMLGLAFMLAAVLIIYYKQISEGYEDQSRFDTMRKVGMSRRDIRKSINSQILLVFFMPLVMSGIHLAFAFPLIRKLLLIFNLTDTGLLIAVTVVCYLVFALFYFIVYRATSRSYYSIVGGLRRSDD